MPTVSTYFWLMSANKSIGGGDKTKNVFSGRTRLSGDDVLNILGNPNIPIPDFRRYRVFLRIRQALLAPAEGYE